MGYNMVRSASMSFAMAQIRKTNQLEAAQPYLEGLWERSTLVASIAYVLARRCTKINPDEALLTGILHGIGKLYVLTRVADHPELFHSKSTLEEIIRDWHAQIGRSILEHWGFSEDLVAAVGDQDDPDRDGVAIADLGDVLAVAILMASFDSDPEGLRIAATGLASLQRLGVDHEGMLTLQQESAKEIVALRSALGA
jgi:HD-like signal output (HDOD) protein